MKFALKFLAASVMLATAAGAFAQKGETVKIAMIEGLSGPFANVGQNQRCSYGVSPARRSCRRDLQRFCNR